MIHGRDSILSIITLIRIVEQRFFWIPKRHMAIVNPAIKGLPIGAGHHELGART